MSLDLRTQFAQAVFVQLRIEEAFVAGKAAAAHFLRHEHVARASTCKRKQLVSQAHLACGASDVNGNKVLSHPLYDMVQRVRRVLFAINLLIIIVNKHTSLKEYINRPSVVDIKQILRCNDVIEAVENSSDNFVPDVTLLNIIKQYIKINILA